MEQTSNDSEFGRALRDSGYDFNSVAGRQHEIFKDSRRKFVGCLAAGLAMLATTANTAATGRSQDTFPAEFSADASVAAFFLEMSRRQVKRMRLMKLEEDNTRALIKIINSARSSPGQQD